MTVIWGTDPTQPHTPRHSRYQWRYLWKGGRAEVYPYDDGSGTYQAYDGLQLMPDGGEHDVVLGSPFGEDIYAYYRSNNAYVPWTYEQSQDPTAGNGGLYIQGQASTSRWSYLPGELWNSVSGAGKEIGYRSADFGNDLLYLVSLGHFGSSNQNLSQLSQLQATGQTTLARATFSSVPIIGSGYNFFAGEDLLTGRQLHGLDRAGAGFGLLSDVAFVSAAGLKLAGVNPAIKLPKLSVDALQDLEALRGRVDAYAQRALDYAVRKAQQKGWTLAENAEAGQLVDRYTKLAARGLNRALVEANSSYRVPSQFGRTARGAAILNGARPAGSAVLDLAITDATGRVVYSGWDTTVSWRWNSAATVQNYLRIFNPQEGFIREINPSIRRY